MQNTQNIDLLVSALVDLIGFLNSPQRDEALLREAGVDLDRALFPLLVRLGWQSPLSVGALADQAGRDHTTVSRQLAKLARLGLVESRRSPSDRRSRAAELTAEGRSAVAAITRARHRLLTAALEDWSATDQSALAALNRRFADALIALARLRDRRVAVGEGG
ncbi:MAG TPA: MarR family transcriptional regulator [Stellaceae bacterium]|nr:MarR family transcriptional regulator [Stellaceae bacterium]